MQPDSPRTPSWTWAGLPALALLAALGFFGVFALPYLLLDANTWPASRGGMAG